MTRVRSAAQPDDDPWWEGSARVGKNAEMPPDYPVITRALTALFRVSTILQLRPRKTLP